MPFIQLDDVSSGPIKINYSISTPTSASAERIDPNLPTVLFLHPVYLAQETFAPQFNDPIVRRFNLVALDMRSHGNTVGDVPDDYDAKMAAEDVASFMNALQLPPCHFFAISMGTLPTLQLAVAHPEKVLSMFLVSALGLAEPAEVAEGRKEVYDAWAEAWNTGSEPDEELMSYGIGGALELVCKDRNSPIITALLADIVPRVMVNWNGEHMREYRVATLDFITERKPLSKSELSKIKGPVHLIHCLGDVAYPLESSEEFLNLLKSVGIEASLDTIPEAPHFGSIEYAHLINPIFHDFIMSNTKTSVPPAVELVSSPWNDALKWSEVVDEDSDYYP